LSSRFATSLNGRFKFQKSGQHFVGSNDEPLSIAAMRVRANVGMVELLSRVSSYRIYLEALAKGLANVLENSVAI
jgi:hypothetical protein